MTVDIYIARCVYGNIGMNDVHVSFLSNLAAVLLFSIL